MENMAKVNGSRSKIKFAVGKSCPVFSCGYFFGINGA